MKNVKKALGKNRNNQMLMAVSTAWKAGAAATSRTSAVFYGAVNGAKAGTAFNGWGIAIGAAVGAVVGFIGHVQAVR